MARAAEFERAGQVAQAVGVFEAALAAAPENIELLTGLARLAERMQSPALALNCWRLVLGRDAGRLEAAEGAARALTQLGRHDEAAALIAERLKTAPDASGLWTMLGAIANEQGDGEAALRYFGQAVRLDPENAAPRYNRGGVHLERGELEAATEDFARALSLARSPEQRAAAEVADSFVKFSLGRLEEGWAAYEARLSPDHPESPIFHVAAPRWTPETPLAGAHLLVVGEQGVGDQIMFADVLADAQAAVGPAGRLSVALDARLAALVQRRAPAAQLLPLNTERVAGRVHHRVPAPPGAPVSAWAPIGSLPRRFRRRAEDFPSAPSLAPDPDAVRRWRDWLADGPPAIGLSWRSRTRQSERRRHAPPLEAWAPILRTPGLRFVNLQYGAGDDERKWLAAVTGGAVLEAPGLDVERDLDGLAALCVALDLVVSIPNATGLLAAACGARVRLVDAAVSWRRLGMDRYPWGAGARSLPAALGGVWDQAIEELAAEAARLAGAGRG